METFSLLFRKKWCTRTERVCVHHSCVSPIVEYNITLYFPVKKLKKLPHNSFDFMHLTVADRHNQIPFYFLAVEEKLLYAVFLAFGI